MKIPKSKYSTRKESGEKREGKRNLRAAAFRRNLGTKTRACVSLRLQSTSRGMGGFGVRHCDGNGHQFSLLSEDLSVSRKLDLPFDKHEYVHGGSCGELLYFHGEMDKRIIIISLTTNETIVVPPPEFNPPPYKPHTEKSELLVSGLGYDAKSGEFKLIRLYEEEYFGKNRPKQFLDLYQFNSLGLWKEPQRPRCVEYMNGTSVYLGQTGSCYWVGFEDSAHDEYFEHLDIHRQRCQEPSRSGVTAPPDSQLMHVVSFDFATERLGRLPLPAPPIAVHLRYKLVRYDGLLGAVVYDVIPGEKEKMAVEVFVWEWDVESWKSVSDVVYLDALKPVGLKDDRLFLEAKMSGEFNQLMVYDFKTKESKKLDIYGYVGEISVVCYGAESSDPPLPDSIPEAKYDFSRKMRKSNKGKKKKNKTGKGKEKGSCR